MVADVPIIFLVVIVFFVVVLDAGIVHVDKFVVVQVRQLCIN